MKEACVCGVCLAMNDVHIIVKKKNDDLLMKLRLVERDSIVKTEYQQQSTCRACSKELQIVYDLLSQYEATYNKLRTLCLHRESEKINFSSVSIQEKEQKTQADTIVAEIVVKEEMFSDDNNRLEGLGMQTVTSRVTSIDKFNAKNVNTSNILKSEKISGINSSESEIDVCQTHELKRYNGNCDAYHDNEKHANEYSNADLPMECEINDDVIKEETKFADEAIEKVGRSEHSGMYYTEKPERTEETCEAVTLEAAKRDDKGNGSNECNTRNQMFYNDPMLETSKKSDGSVENGQEIGKLQKRHSKRDPFNGEEFCVSFSHQVPHTGPGGFKCERCGKTFSKERSMKQHQQLHLNPDAFKCEHCNKRYTSRLSLGIHKTTHRNLELFTCNQCGKSFSQAYLLKEHEKWHANPDAFKCERCDKRFSAKQALEEHQITHSYTCDQCNKSFPYINLLKDHQMLHSNPDAFKCEHCQRRFSHRSKLTQHKIGHLYPELVKCDQCEKSFEYVYLLKQHQMLHSNPDAFKCGHCGKRFSSKKNLAQHKIKHSNPELVTCDQCGKSFATEHLMNEHQTLHSNPDAFKCDQCGKRYSSKLSLARHKVTHTSPESVTCDRCEKSFECVYVLKKHQMLHSNPDALKRKKNSDGIK